MSISDSGRSRSLVPAEDDQSAHDDAGVRYIAAGTIHSDFTDISPDRYKHVAAAAMGERT